MQNTGLLFGIISVTAMLLILFMPGLFYFNGLIAFAIPGVIVLSLAGIVVNIIAYSRTPQGKPKVKTIIGLILCVLTAFFTII